MITFLAFTSIIALTGIAFAIRRLARLPLCPICAGVTGTWAWLLLGSWYGLSVDPMLPAILMGGSVVGIAYQLERFVPSGRSLLMKVLFVPLGFLAVYGALVPSWPLVLGAGSGALAVCAAFLLLPRGTPDRDGANERLMKELEQCC